ncbi:MAG: 1-acyl-sn-glycerol-3-phosphate acyltransferase [Thiopseudomonas sp.]|nr:1-acyl-sn-glycerol-3-phosphate acyltransferase [Thiopseudomonas sp.]MBP9614646.1 1-acyl-sn-glycerol-3-phosphate acyltransferase [Thiopseudomonas sp.]
MDQFDSIRPYNDDEVAAVLQRLLADADFLSMITQYRFPTASRYIDWLLRPITAWKLRNEIRKVHSVAALQQRIEAYVEQSISQVTDGISFSGIEHLQTGKPHLYLANHRDIVMDPAFVNYALFQAKLSTPRIAIGDNLLQRPFVSDLMRINKSFIVHRSLTNRREKLTAFQLLSAYINHSILHDQESIWIAQAEGRAKDGDDRTESAILKMFHLSRKDEDFQAVIASLQLTPVAISYEYDPCDIAKARELYIRASTGEYTKQIGEDDASIVLGITGYKGRVHVHFCPVLTTGFTDTKQLAQLVDQHIWRDYRLFPAHYLAWGMWDQRDTSLPVPDIKDIFDSQEILNAQQHWQKRLDACPAEHRPYLIMQYAMPVENQYRNTQLPT